MKVEKRVLLGSKKIRQKSSNKRTNKIKLKNYINKNIRNKVLAKENNHKFLLKKFFLFIIAPIIVIISLSFIYIKYKRTKMHNIPIAFSLNKKYAYPLIVSLTSILYNSGPNTFYTFYLLLAPDSEEHLIKKILDLREKYTNCKIQLIHMGNKYHKYKSHGYNTPTVYYRLELSNIINNTDKIIYLDVDTMTHKDLTEFYNIDIGNYYYMGAPALDLTRFEFHGTRNYINSGVILINLKKLREVNAPLLFYNYYKKYGTKKIDEYLINAVFYDKVSFLPLIYGIPDFGVDHMVINSSYFVKRFKGLVNFTESEMELASKNRAITHGCYTITKWWKMDYHRMTNVGKQWLFYASKSNAFDDICSIYNQFESYCNRLKNEK